MYHHMFALGLQSNASFRFKKTNQNSTVAYMITIELGLFGDDSVKY